MNLIRMFVLLVAYTPMCLSGDDITIAPATETTADVATLEADYYVSKLFTKYGEQGKLSFEGFEHLMENLGLGMLHIGDHQLKDHFDDYGQFLQLHSSHDHTADPKLIDDHDHVHHDHDSHHHVHDNHVDDDGDSKHDHEEDHNGEELDDHDHNHDQNDEHSHMKRSLSNVLEITHGHNHDQCLSAADILTFYHRDTRSPFINENFFMKLCPAILYQLDNEFCRNKNLEDQTGPSDEASTAFWKVSASAWGWAFLAVTIISLVGLASVAVIPIMDKVFYNHLLQFLVSLAIGTLSGDALLHLLPHATSGGHGDEDGSHSHDNDVIWKGLVVLGGIYAFFMVERCMTLMSRWKKRKNQKSKLKLHTDVPSVSYKRHEKTCKNTIIMGVQSHKDGQMGIAPPEESEREGMLQQNIAEDLEDNCKADDCEEGGMLDKCEKHIDEAREHHGHSHEVPGSVSSAAWMVIMGDGLHNFTDGLAIGAAFADNLSVGLSTTVAVFCHELPHELGDFAVLLRAGMPVKQALVYNIVSSILCVIGMVGGLLLGNLESAHGWIYALTAGIFIYISLVDMLPEITSVNSPQGEYACNHLLLQIVGITIGMGIMLVIALYEHKIVIDVNQ